MRQTLRIVAVLLFVTFLGGAPRCSGQTGCPVLPSLASSKLPWPEGGERIVIWFFNQGRKTTHGIQFELLMVDAVGNRYRASQKYIVTGEIKPQTGDVVIYPVDPEKGHLEDIWGLIDGVEVRVTRIMFKDNTVWVPQKGQVCKMVFLNDQYQAEIERRWNAVEKKSGQQGKNPQN